MTYRSFRLSLLVSLLAVTAIAQTHLSANATPVFLANADLRLAPQRIIGRGLDFGPLGVSRGATTNTHDEIIWKKVRDVVDQRGRRHAFYDQMVGDAELYGSEIGMHYGEDGKLKAIAGAQYETVNIANNRAFSAWEAVDRAAIRVAERHTVAVKAPSTLPPGRRAGRSQSTALKLVQRGKAFRYAYFTFVEDLSEAMYQVVMDATSEEILDVVPWNKGANCNPSEPWSMYTAWRVPVRPDVAPPSSTTLWANSTFDRGDVTYEGFYAGNPNISVTQEISDPAFTCSGLVEKAYSLFPMFASRGTSPRYEDRSAGGYTWQGRAAGDAMYHTMLTMDTFAMLGRTSFDNLGSDANVVVDSTYQQNPEPYTSDGAWFQYGHPDSPQLPPRRGIVLINKAFYAYYLSAALDVVAHEWGHGVIDTSVGGGYYGQRMNNLQIDEGLADVIGHIVELTKQSPGYGPEHSSDWKIGEDASTGSNYLRGAVDDDVSGHHFGGVNGNYPQVVNDLLHQGDEPSNQSTYGRAVMLDVVFSLLTDGGYNPICLRNNTLLGCSQAVNALTFPVARKIMFDAIQYYIPRSVGWGTLGDYVRLAAYDSYSECNEYPPYPATAEQNAVTRAFQAIGYPPPGYNISCP